MNSETKQRKPETKPAKRETVGTRPVDATHLRQVYEWLLEGHSRQSIVEAAVEKLPGTDIEVLIQNAIEHIRAASEQPADLVTAWCMESARLVFAKMMTIADYANALKALKLIDEMSRKMKRTPAKGQLTPMDYLTE